MTALSIVYFGAKKYPYQTVKTSRPPQYQENGKYQLDSFLERLTPVLSPEKPDKETVRTLAQLRVLANDKNFHLRFQAADKSKSSRISVSLSPQSKQVLDKLKTTLDLVSLSQTLFLVLDFCINPKNRERNAQEKIKK